jgi:hypothetical protein
MSNISRPFKQNNPADNPDDKPKAFSITPIKEAMYRGTLGDILDCHPDACIYVRLPGTGKTILIDRDDAANLHDEIVIFTSPDQYSIFIH